MDELNIVKSTRVITRNFFVVTPKLGTSAEKQFWSAGYKNGINVAANNARSAFKVAKKVVRNK